MILTEEFAPLPSMKKIHADSKSKGLKTLTASNKRVSRLAVYLDVTETQAVLFVLIFQQFFSSGNMGASLEDLADDFDCSVLDLLAYLPDLDALVDKKLISRQRNGWRSAEVISSTFDISENITRKIAAGEPIDGLNPLSNNSKLHLPERIEKQKLFYNRNNSIEINRLFDTLKVEKLETVRASLARQNLPTGLSVLLYGPPGTGKTSMVEQLARHSGRAVYKVDISKINSRWVGESEKRIKKVFTDYRKMLKSEKVEPILFFEEADNLLSTRVSVERSIDQMTNRVQSILLQELESHSGLLVATTNLAKSLDIAYSRRFLFKVKVEAPDLETRQQIWEHKLPELPKEQARILTRSFALSGGEIDNIVRKTIMDKVLEGVDPSLDRLMAYCSHENLHQEKKPRIGFVTTIKNQKHV